MSQTTIANRYARALADVITERRETNEVVAELGQFEGILTQHTELRDVFASPVLPLERKRAVLNDLLTRMQLRPTANNFLQLLLNNARLHNLDQMLRATNARRRARGKPELTEDSIARELAKETALAHKRRDDYVGDLEVAQMLDAKNARRLRKGQPPLSLEEYKRQIGGPL